jgi:hypothetical protein
MILRNNDTYWTTGISLRWDGSRWGGRIDYYDDGFCDDDPDGGRVSTEGVLRTRYMVRDGKESSALRAVVDTLIGDAQRLGIRLGGPDGPPALYYDGDGEGADYPPPDGWRELVAAEAQRVGWKCPYNTKEG